MAVSYSVRIAFASNPFDVTPTWVDVSTDLMSFHIRRGRQWELNRMEPGTCTLRLRNLHGDYWPTNTAGTYYPNVLPWKRINIRAVLGVTQASGHTVDDDAATSIFDVNWKGQTFLAPSNVPSVIYAKLKLYRTGSPGTITVGIRATSGGIPVGADLDSGTLDGNTLTTDTAGAWYTINFSGNLSLTGGVTYALVVSAPSGDAANTVKTRVDSTVLSYTDGTYVTSGDSGASWAADSFIDMMFEVYGDGSYDLYTGYIESWQPDFIMRPIKAPIMDLSCSDGIKNLSLFTLTCIYRPGKAKEPRCYFDGLRTPPSSPFLVWFFRAYSQIE